MLSAIHNPFLSLSTDFSATATPKHSSSIPSSKMFGTGSEEIEGVWLEGNQRFMRGIGKLGEVLNGGR